MTSIWALIDDRPGNATQVLGVAEAMAVPFETKHIRYNRRAGLPNVLLGASLAGTDRAQSAPLTAPWPDVVIAAGRRTAPVARYIKRRNPSCFLVQIMWPEAGIRDFGLIALPAHDAPHEGPQILRTLVPPHRITTEKLATEKALWEPQFSNMGAPRIALLVGGGSKHGQYRDRDFAELAGFASALAGSSGSILATSSRRTGRHAEELLRKRITAPCFFHQWNAGGDNPYTALLGAADAVIVTGDSMSMCAEACFTGKPVFIYAPPHATPPKHHRLHTALYTLGAAKPLTATANLFTPARQEELSAAHYIANAIRRRREELKQ